MPDIRKYSSIVVDGNDRAPNRSMLRATGFKDEDFKKPQIGVVSTWSMLTPCNMHIEKWPQKAGEGTNGAGGKGIIFGPIPVAAGISLGTEGIKYFLVSPEG